MNNGLSPSWSSRCYGPDVKLLSVSGAGHMFWLGPDVEGGIIVELTFMADFITSMDRKIASVGAG